jgi:hypothetical protein
MSNLSPAAQTIVHEYSKIAYDNDVELSFTPLPWERKAIAAALRAAGDTLPHPISAHTLYAIADELDGIKYGTHRCNLEDKPQ